MEHVTFPNHGIDVAADVRLPENYDASKKYPAIVVGHPISSCKEQTSGAIYGEQLSKAGFITVAFDASFQGHSGGEPRFIEDPAARVEDFRCAVDYLTTRDDVDPERIGMLGICGSGGYSVPAAMTDRRVKALGTVVAANYGRILREGDNSAGAAIAGIEAVSAQRTAEANGDEEKITTYIPNSQEEREQAGIEDVDIREAVDYYRTPRAQAEGSPNKLLFSSLAAAYAFDAFHLADQLLTQPLLVIAGSIPGGFGSYRDAYELFDKAASKDKELFIVDGATHYSLYDQPEQTSKSIPKLVEFYNKNL